MHVSDFSVCIPSCSTGWITCLCFIRFRSLRRSFSRDTSCCCSTLSMGSSANTQCGKYHSVVPQCCVYCGTHKYHSETLSRHSVSHLSEASSKAGCRIQALSVLVLSEQSYCCHGAFVNPADWIRLMYQERQNKANGGDLLIHICTLISPWLWFWFWKARTVQTLVQDLILSWSQKSLGSFLCEARRREEKDVGENVEIMFTSFSNYDLWLLWSGVSSSLHLPDSSFILLFYSIILPNFPSGMIKVFLLYSMSSQ